MLHLNGLFESSLRNGEALSPICKKRTLVKHTGCKGSVHGSGNYNKPPPVTESPCDNQHLNVASSFKRVPSKRFNKNVDLPSIAKKPPSESKAKTANSASVSSSENFSETDSVDSLSEKGKCNETVSRNRKPNDISSRLFNNVTKSSIAKTAKMRHLDIFDVEENGWAGGLRKSDHSQKESNNSSPFKRSGSLRKSTDFNLEGRNSFRRRSFNLPKIKSVNYEDIVYISNYKKTNGLFIRFDKTNCYKDLKDLNVASDLVRN